MTNKEIREIFEDIFFEDDYIKTSRLRDPEFKLNEANNYVVTLFGGMNGWGNSIEYLEDFSRLLKGLWKNGVSGYIVDLNIDALDDVFSITIELRDLNEFYKEKPE